MFKQIIVSVSVLALLLSGCSFFEEETSYSSVVFNLVADTKIEEDSSNVTLNFEADEVLRSLEIDYSIVFPVKSEDSDNEDFETEAYFGGAQYDSYEEIMKLIDSEDFEYEEHENPNFFVTLTEEDGDEKKFEFYWHDTSEDFEKVKDYYTYVVAFFTEDV